MVVTAAAVVSSGVLVVLVVVMVVVMVVVVRSAAGTVMVFGAFLSLPFPFLLPGRAHLDLVAIVGEEMLVWVLVLGVGFC